MDPPVACHICRYLSDDFDTSVSTLARTSAPKLKCSVVVFDASNSDDLATTREDLNLVYAMLLFSVAVVYLSYLISAV
jgi:hypothetical protein